jgi:hypothetical protein
MSDKAKNPEKKEHNQAAESKMKEKVPEKGMPRSPGLCARERH